MTEKWMYADGKRLACLNGKDVCLDFIEKFGGIGVGLGGEFLHCDKDKDDVGYRFPAELKDEQILEAIEKSVKDNHDYVLDLIAKPENKIPLEDDPDCEY